MFCVGCCPCAGGPAVGARGAEDRGRRNRSPHQCLLRRVRLRRPALLSAVLPSVLPALLQLLRPSVLSAVLPTVLSALLQLLRPPVPPAGAVVGVGSVLSAAALLRRPASLLVLRRT